MEKWKRPPGQLVFQLMLLAGSLVLFHQAFRISGLLSVSGAGVFPMLATGAMAISIGIGIVKELSAIRRDRETVSGSGGGQSIKEVIPPLILGYIAVCALYVSALEYVGFHVSTGLFLFISFVVLHRGSILMAAAIALACLAVTHVLFATIFQVYLP